MYAKTQGNRLLKHYCNSC